MAENSGSSKPEPTYTIMAWGFVILLLLVGAGLLLWMPRPTNFTDSVKLVAAVTGVPAFVGVAFYGRLSNELTGVLLGVILGFVFGATLH